MLVLMALSTDLASTCLTILTIVLHFTSPRSSPSTGFEATVLSSLRIPQA